VTRGFLPEFQAALAALAAERDRYREALEQIERMTDRTVNRHREVSRGAISAVAREALRP